MSKPCEVKPYHGGGHLVRPGELQRVDGAQDLVEVAPRAGRVQQGQLQALVRPGGQGRRAPYPAMAPRRHLPGPSGDKCQWAQAQNGSSSADVGTSLTRAEAGEKGREVAAVPMMNTARHVMGSPAASTSSGSIIPHSLAIDRDSSATR
jgi:hypothetical protein